MTRHTEKPLRANSYLALSLLTLACLIISAFAASGANAFTRTITDIEDPAVEAKVLGLEVQATRTFHAEYEYEAMILQTIDWDHSLAGRFDNSLTAEQRPKVTIQRNPTVVRIAGQLVTEQAEGQEQYSDFDSCFGGRETTKSPLLEVSLNGFYQSGTSSSSGNPEASLTTENLDPWVQTCPYLETEPQATQVQTFASPTVASTTVNTVSALDTLKSRWSPDAGELTTTKNACTPEFCDFTISGHNKNLATAVENWSVGGMATTTFNLRLRLEFPAEPPPEEPISTPDTKITKSPRKMIRTKTGKAKIAFAFRSTGPGGTRFKCRLDKRPFRFCRSPFKRKVGPGRHRFAVASVDQGRVDQSPAVYKWTVKKKPKRATKR